MSKNTFSISGDVLTIYRDEWGKIATATVRPDYLEEIQTPKWTKNNNYLQSSTLGTLHSYIIKKWYTEPVYRSFIDNGFIVEHMDGDGFNCQIENLCFLPYGENIAKGHTLDKYTQDKRYIALNLFKDFQTQLYQITIAFNYPAKLICDDVSNAVVDLAFLLYDKDTPYEIVINNARHIMLEYSYYKTFTPSKLNFIDFQIEGEYRQQSPIQLYESYINGAHQSHIAYMEKKHMIENWTMENKISKYIMRVNPKKHCPITT